MKLATCGYEGKTISGVIINDSIIPFSEIFGKDYSMLEFINFQNEEKLSQLPLNEKDFPGIPLDKITLLSPIPYPFRNVICLGKNYSGHIKELASFTGVAANSEKPIYFTKSAYPAVAPGGFISSHQDITGMLDYEAELAVIIGKPAKNISADEAYDYVFGYTILNDISARDIQKSHTQWFRGKSLDLTCPIGPWIVTAAEFNTPIELDISCYVNGELRQSSNTRHMIFSIPFVVSELSKGMQLYPGDIIATGTPEGVGQGFDPPKYLRPGDTTECVIENIGSLKNTIK
ncbi:MAG: fumarylacetoacetate hydrolase family protein [Clostridiales bacterium]|jgi:2-keto-4-pentenoate hydratase/2-oxohepta-3-ene-1,7-dioic acid hydratase in catechol pathway|nr:fumarylacetoacetate hydrolase family protein [Clostridiales bacterium]